MQRFRPQVLWLAAGGLVAGNTILYFKMTQFQTQVEDMRRKWSEFNKKLAQMELRLSQSISKIQKFSNSNSPEKSHSLITENSTKSKNFIQESKTTESTTNWEGFLPKRISSQIFFGLD